MKKEFSKSSAAKLSTCHKDMQLIMNTAIGVSDVDFGIAEGHRVIALQQKYFKEGKSKIDGIKRKGKHNYIPSMAADIFPFIEGRADWDNSHLNYISGIIHAVAEMLILQGKITHRIRWGGNWDMDGVILRDQSFDDRPHFELVNL